MAGEQFARAPMLCRHLLGDGVGALSSSPPHEHFHWTEKISFYSCLPWMHWHVSTSEPPSPLAHRIPVQTRGVDSSWLGGNGWKVRLKTHKTKVFRAYKTPHSWHKYQASIGEIEREMGQESFQAWWKGKESKTKQSWGRGLLLLTCLESSGASSKSPYQDFQLLVPCLLLLPGNTAIADQGVKFMSEAWKSGLLHFALCFQVQARHAVEVFVNSQFKSI